MKAWSSSFTARLAAAHIGSTYNQYADSELRRTRLRGYLDARADAPVLLVGEAAGYRGARVSGIPFTSERQLTGTGPAEATATIVHRVLAELGIEDDVLLWNVVPTHPGHRDVQPARRPAPRSPRGCLFLRRARPRGAVSVAVGRLAAAGARRGALRPPSVARRARATFARGLVRALDQLDFATIPPRRSLVTAAPLYEDLQRQTRRDHARVVSRRRRGQDPRPPRDPDRRHAARQAASRSTRRTSTPATSSSS